MFRNFCPVLADYSSYEPAPLNLNCLKTLEEDGEGGGNNFPWIHFTAVTEINPSIIGQTTKYNVNKSFKSKQARYRSLL